MREREYVECGDGFQSSDGILPLRVPTASSRWSPLATARSRRHFQRLEAVATFLLALTTALHAQDAFDAEKTKALFAGSEWWGGTDGLHEVYTFKPDGTLDIKAKGWGHSAHIKDRVTTWTATGSRSVKGEKKDWVMSSDGKELHTIREDGKRFQVYYRGKAQPPEYPHLRATLAKPGIVWVEHGAEERLPFAFNGELELVWDGVARTPLQSLTLYGGGAFLIKETTRGWVHFFLVRDEKGEFVLRDVSGRVYKSEPAQLGDSLPPQMISRARSPINGTTWCRPDGKGKVLTLTFVASGTVSDSAIPNEKPEWIPYDDGRVRYKDRTMKLSEDKKILMREDNKVREIWFMGRQPPRMSMTDEKQLKELLADKAKAWVNWDNSTKTVYIFDDKTADVTISVDDIKQKTVRWSVLCAGCIRIGDEAFMVEGETLERVEPRLTLKRVARESVR